MEQAKAVCRNCGYELSKAEFAAVKAEAEKGVDLGAGAIIKVWCGRRCALADGRLDLVNVWGDDTTDPYIADTGMGGIGFYFEVVSDKRK